ncbi:MAG: Metallo-beta-lactamase family protein, RNA-specific [uncultured Thiotrichaceae bacterium]|uniref:Metallo-beta-lactamase family protein, RNA-specific n=1 Tax=uncultured Thiotrichaceae bacterium TaxID=298394 RepID=A0A6S6UDT1_9GAMM|nr:MAG: Metallo-beta-lactamase family protein, RNA-specific [uncultured Thiotrichaceae bacterium]
MNYPQISHHGAVTGVTGSCHELKLTTNESVLIDCGIFQGSDYSPHGKADAHHLELDFPIDNVKALILTHCHIDHAGRIPWLIAAGFDGPIYCSHPTSKLLPVMLADAAKIGITRDNRIIEKLIDRVESLVQPINFNTWLSITESLRIRLQRAGHILGSAYVECEVNNDADKRIIFSGDLGAPHAPLLPAAKSPQQCHTLVIESTYGHKRHDDRTKRQERLRNVIEHCFRNQGAVLIPAFSLGRTQELMYEFEQIIHENTEQWHNIDIVLDSPLAGRITNVYRELRPYWDDEAQDTLAEGRYPLTYKQVICVETHDQHKKMVKFLSKTARPTVVISASGMCNGGRITDYLKTLLPDKRTDIIFTGYQARGSIGRQILKYGPKHGFVEIDEERISINANVHLIGGYSAHADQQDLLDFAMNIGQGPNDIRIVHGDDDAKQTLKQKMEDEVPSATVSIPRK